LVEIKLNRIKRIFANIRRNFNLRYRNILYKARSFKYLISINKNIRILLIAYYNPIGLRTIVDNIISFINISKYTYDVINLYSIPYSKYYDYIPNSVNLKQYNAIIFHNTTTYNNIMFNNIYNDLSDRLCNYKGVIIVMKQDEHYRINDIINIIHKLNTKIILTCLKPEYVRMVYNIELFPNVEFLHVLTGYITHEMRNIKCNNLENRQIDIGYRGSKQPYSFGRLSYEKQEIGNYFIKLCKDRGIVADISSEYNDRIYENKWFEFLGNCKATLGVESGASVFDFTGEIENNCFEYLKINPNAEFETVQKLFLNPYENKIYYNQISPRHFEAAACRTLQIMYEGEYSGIYIPYRHYIPLKRDKTNIEDVLERFNNIKERKRITENAFNDIVMNDINMYSTFVKQFDNLISKYI